MFRIELVPLQVPRNCEGHLEKLSDGFQMKEFGNLRL